MSKTPMEPLKPARIFSPAKILKEELEARGITSVEGVNIQAILHGKTITDMDAALLSNELGMSAQFWINVQKGWDESNMFAIEWIAGEGKIAPSFHEKVRLPAIFEILEIINTNELLVLIDYSKKKVTIKPSSDDDNALNAIVEQEDSGADLSLEGLHDILEVHRALDEPGSVPWKDIKDEYLE